MINKFVIRKTKTEYLTFMAILLLILTSCAPAPPEPTPITPSPSPIPPTETKIPPTATLEPTATATLKPTEVVIPGPSPRYNVSFAYDSESNQIILFGGAIDYYGPIILDTWAYDVAANHWKEMKPKFVPKGIGFLAYDSESDRVIMFSLFSGDYEKLGVTNQTWAYDYNTDTWTRMSDHPLRLIGGPIAYDAESDRIILFGGYNTIKESQTTVTWAFDYNTDTWTEMKPPVSPPGRDSHLMTYDVKADRILIFGGDYLPGNQVDESLWSYDFNTNRWEELKPDEESHPLSRLYSTLAYDSESDRTILFGGWQMGKDYGTWSYDYNTNTWLDMKPAEVPGRVTNHYMAYIPSIDRVFLFGGDLCDKSCNLSNEIWLYDLNSNTWENLMPLP